MQEGFAGDKQGLSAAEKKPKKKHKKFCGLQKSD